MRRFSSLDDFLAAEPLTVNERFGDETTGFYPVKGRELDATVLFADMSNFTARSKELSPVQTLIFLNNFVSWLTSWAVAESSGIIDKYIGDELMVVFSEEFGSSDPFAEAIQTGRWIGQHDMQGFVPHIGIASGRVVVGYVGTPLRYETSVFGSAVPLAARCAKETPPMGDAAGGAWGSWMVFPASEWGDDRRLEEVIPPDRDGIPSEWKLLPPRTADFKGLGEVVVRDLVRDGLWWPGIWPEDHARREEEKMRKYSKRYFPLDSSHEMSGITDLFAGVPVSDLDVSIDWYSRFFGRPPDMHVGDEVLWDIDEHATLFIEPNAERAGAGRITLAVAGLDALLDRLVAQGIEHEPIETYSNGVRHVNIPDPDRNMIAFAEPPPDAVGT